jgi:predicted nuclease with TOPRIM domain
MSARQKKVEVNEQQAQKTNLTIELKEAYEAELKKLNEAIANLTKENAQLKDANITLEKRVKQLAKKLQSVENKWE